MQRTCPPHSSGAVSNNRQQLIVTAADLFHRQGYQATGLEQLLAATGVARSNFYYHFRGKRDLAVEVVRHWTRVYDEELVEPALGDPSLQPRDRLHALFERAAASQDPATGRTGCPLGRLTVDLAAHEPAVQRVLDDYFASLRGRIAASLRTPPLGEVLSEPQVQHLADLALCALEGSLLISHLRSDPASVRRAGAALLDVVDRFSRRL
jgi:AcrR family transcriptional regulator